jgi:hypothetical protein
MRRHSAAMKKLSKGCTRIAMDNKRHHTSLVTALVSPKQVSGRQVDSAHLEIAAENAATKEMKLAVLTLETDIFLSHDANGEDDY